MVESEDPTVIRSIAVRAEDVVTALEATRRSGRQTVLRVTPPYSGRMRARLHETSLEPEDDETTRDEGTAEPILVDPSSLVESSLPPYPDPADTEDVLRSDPDREYSRERHREVHREAVEEWRERVPAHVVESVRLDTVAGSHEVDVTILG